MIGDYMATVNSREVRFIQGFWDVKVGEVTNCHQPSAAQL